MDTQEIRNGYAKNTQGIRKKYARDTQEIRNGYARNTQGIRKGCLLRTRVACWKKAFLLLLVRRKHLANFEYCFLLVKKKKNIV